MDSGAKESWTTMNKIELLNLLEMFARDPKQADKNSDYWKAKGVNEVLSEIMIYINGREEEHQTK